MLANANGVVGRRRLKAQKPINLLHGSKLKLAFLVLRQPVVSQPGSFTVEGVIVQCLLIDELVVTYSPVVEMAASGVAENAVR